MSSQLRGNPATQSPPVLTIPFPGAGLYWVRVESSLVSDFARAVAGPDSSVDLFGAAMVIARISGRAVDGHKVARELDLFAEAVRDYAGEGATDDQLAHAIDHQLFIVQGFHGNALDYANPENSFLDAVVRRRTGLPITLSLVYMEVAERVGLRCEGIGYPGHFIVRTGNPDSEGDGHAAADLAYSAYIDPFYQGARLDREELLAGLRGKELGGATPESFLSAVTRRQILQRMLNNLHTLFRERSDAQAWREAVDLLLQLQPWDTKLIGERGMLNYRLGRHEQALTDLEQYAAATGEQDLSAGARRLLDDLRLRIRPAEEAS